MHLAPQLFASLGVNPRNGFGDVLEKIKALPEAQQVRAVCARPPLRAT